MEELLFWGLKKQYLDYRLKKVFESTPFNVHFSATELWKELYPFTHYCIDESLEYKEFGYETVYQGQVNSEG